MAVQFASCYVLYIKDNLLHYAHNYVATQYLRVASSAELTAGRVELRYEFEPTGDPDLGNGKGSPGRGQLYMDGTLVGQEEFPVTTPLLFGLGGGVSTGRDEGAPVLPDYQPPFEFTGTIHQVTVDVSGELIEDDEATMRAVMAHQ